MRHKNTFIAAGTVAGATLGAGVFALPYLTSVAGIIPTVAFLVGLSAVVIYAHTLYWRVLKLNPAGTQMLQLAREHLGPTAARATSISTIFGLILTVAAYLVLGTTFIESLFNIPHAYATLLFWAICSLPLVFRLPRFIGIELLLTGLMGAALVALVLTIPVSLSVFPLISWEHILLPFGPILFALAGWTAVEPALAATRGEKGHRIRSLGLGTISVAIAYVLFALVLGSASSPITPDTISGVLHLPFWQLAVLLLFGVAAIVTSYLPMNLELKNAFRRGLHWPRSWAFTVALFLPYVLLLAGFNNFLYGVELVGGIFLATQYIAILQICRKALNLKGRHLLAVNLVSIVFALAAVFHILSFVAPGIGLR
jgi:amino acid permease